VNKRWKTGEKPCDKKMAEIRRPDGKNRWEKGIATSFPQAIHNSLPFHRLLCARVFSADEPIVIHSYSQFPPRALPRLLTM